MVTQDQRVKFAEVFRRCSHRCMLWSMTGPSNAPARVELLAALGVHVPKSKANISMLKKAAYEAFDAQGTCDARMETDLAKKCRDLARAGEPDGLADIGDRVRMTCADGRVVETTCRGRYVRPGGDPGARDGWVIQTSDGTENAESVEIVGCSRH